MSVHIIDYKERVNANDESFFALILEGDVEMVQSQETGRFYATARRASVTSTFTEETCKRLIGKTMPGKIVKSPCEPFEYTLPESGEVISLNHRYEYVSPDEAMEDEVFERTPSSKEALPI